MEKTVKTLGIVCLLVMAGFMGILIFELEVVSAATTIFVDDDNTAGPWDGSLANPYQTIQDGVNNAIDGDTVFVLNGTYFENVVVPVSINLTGMNKDNTTIDGGGGTCVRIASNMTNITGFRITNGSIGIDVWTNVNNVTIKNNNVSANDLGALSRGILLNQSTSYITIINNDVLSTNDIGGYSGIYLGQMSSHNLIEGNNVSSNRWEGSIYLYQSSDNDIMNNNVINDKGDAIELSNSDKNDIIGNNVSSTFERGIYLTSSDNNVITNNTAGGIWLWQSSFNDVIENNVPSAPEGIRLDMSSNNDILANDVITSTFYGIYVADSSNNNTITGNNVSSNNNGILVRDSLNNSIADNNVSVSSYSGIYLESANGNYITGNTMLSYGWYGVVLNFSHGNQIADNILSHNGWMGIRLYSSTGNNVTSNIVSNDDYGIYFWKSDGNNITDNTVASNILYGCYMLDSSNNSIYHNNFIDNAIQAYDDGNNIWNDTYPFGGNYWSDWTFPDADCDGFVDDPRLIPLGPNQDNWPFTEMNGWLSDWVNKSAFSNYALSGMPDFDQREKTQRTGLSHWMTINAGADGVLNSAQFPDDVLISPVPGANNISIAPGMNHTIDSTKMVDDTLEYAYCGPTAAANGLWWLDSKYSDPLGTPRDGLDSFSLVEDLGAGDDHALGIVPLLIEDLALLFETHNYGDTNASRMVNGLNQYLVNHNQDTNFSLSNQSFPEFPVVATEFENCNVAILFLGFYDDEGNRVWGHIVTMSGVNQGGMEIAISDPIKNIANPIATYSSYNDTINVSHDIYDVMMGPPHPSLPPQTWWLNGYTSGYGFPMPLTYWAVVENVVYISPNLVPDAPIGLSTSAGETYVNLSWNAPTSDGGSSITNYRIYRGASSGSETFYMEIGNVTYLNDTSVSLGVTYFYKV
ncbi:MAG: NosD domain-containing protein, partial [Thermoplasmata archaeon]